jgi:hypothetical protein
MTKQKNELNKTERRILWSYLTRYWNKERYRDKSISNSAFANKIKIWVEDWTNILGPQELLTKQEELEQAERDLMNCTCCPNDPNWHPQDYISQNFKDCTECEWDCNHQIY